MKLWKTPLLILLMVLLLAVPSCLAPRGLDVVSSPAKSMLVVRGPVKWNFEKPKLRDVLARQDAALVLDTNGRIRRHGPHVAVRPKYYVRKADQTIVELDAETEQPAEPPSVGTAAPVTWFEPALPADFGPTIDVSGKPLWSSPFEEKEVWQGQNGTCYQLVVYQSALREKPGWMLSKDVLARRGDGKFTVIYRRDPLHPFGVVLDPLVSQLDSRLNPKTGACAIPVLERGYDFARTFNATTKTSTNTRASTNFGWMGAVMTDFGIKNLAIYPSQSTSQTALMAALASDQLVTCCTKPSPTSGLTVGAHAYSIINISMEGSTTWVVLRNPWGFDGAGNDGDTSDGLIRETWAQFAGDMSAACVSTEYPRDVELAVVNPASIPGDANGDGRVDFSDFTILSNHYGKVTAKGAVDGDFNADGVVNFADYVMLSNNWSKDAGDVPAVAITLPTLDIVKPAPGADPSHITVTGRPGVDAIELVFTTDADSVVMTSPGNAPGMLPLKDGGYRGYISTIPTSPKTFTYTATRKSDGATTVKTITLAPADIPPPSPAPAEILLTIDVYKDGSVKKR